MKMMTQPTHNSSGTVAELKLVQRLLEEQPTRHSGVFGICTELIDDCKRSHGNTVGYCIQLRTRDDPHVPLAHTGEARYGRPHWYAIRTDISSPSRRDLNDRNRSTNASFTTSVDGSLALPAHRLRRCTHGARGDRRCASGSCTKQLRGRSSGRLRHKRADSRRANHGDRWNTRRRVR